MHRSNLLLAFFISVFCFISTYCIFGFYYTDYQGFASGLCSGKMTPGVPFRSLYFITNYGVSYFYSILYQLLPDVEWLSWIYSIYSFIACFIGLFIVAILLPSQTSLKVKIIVLCGVYYLVFASNNIHFVCSHISYMTCGLSLIGLICFFKSIPVIKERWPLFLLLNILFTLGTLTRVEPGTACCMLMVLFSILYLRDWKQSIIVMTYPFLLILSLSLIISIDIKNSTEFYKQIEPDIEAEFENRENKVPLSFMKTHRDTVLYNTASDIVWSDPKIITPQFLRSLIQTEKPIFTDIKQWKRVYRNIDEMLTKYWFLVSITLLLALGLFVQYDFKKQTYSLYYWLAFEFSFFVLIVIQTYVYKLNDRSFSPYISLFIFCHIILIIANIKDKGSRWLYIILPVFLCLFVTHLRYLIVESRGLKKDLANYELNYEKIKEIARNKYLVLNSSSCDYICLSNVPFRPFDFSSFKRVYVTEGSIIPFIPYYKQYLTKECKCDIYAYPSFYGYLRSLNDEVIFVSSPHRMETIRTYLREIHNYTLPIHEDSVPLVKVEKNESNGDFDVLKVYRLGK